MPEWWTYTLSDFLLFSPRTYYRLLERFNEAVWPWQLAALALGLALLALLVRRPRWQGRAMAAILALLWTWVAWVFLRQRYATINWSAGYLAWLFAGEGVLLLWFGTVRGRLAFRAGRSRTGLALFGVSLGIYPVLAPLLGRGLGQAELFGVLPDPTAIGTLGLLLLADGPGRAALLAPPAAWCALAAATLWAMGSAEAWLSLAALVLAAWECWRRRAGA
jgi:hypothetical protein